MSPSSESMNRKLHVAMFPWLAYGHMIPFLHLSNELAKRGHKVSVLLPKNATLKLANLNLHPHLITFHALTLPPVEGAPPGAETSSDSKDSLALARALDGTRDQVKAILVAAGDKPDFIFFDFAYWIPEVASEIGCKSVYFKVIGPTISALGLVVLAGSGKTLTASDLTEPPPEYPSSKVVLREHEARQVAQFANIPGNQMTTLFERGFAGMRTCDALAMRTCKEIEGQFCDYIASHFGRRPMLYTGLILPEIQEDPLDPAISNFLEKSRPNSVVFCAFGNERHMEKDQFQELLLGFEKTGLPFLLALRAPKGANSIDEALPEGFQERVKDRGMVRDWVPQTQVLAHKSIGCFVNHCGYGSMWEALLSHCQLVFVPNIIDQTLNTRLMADELGVAVEVEKGENGWISKENLCRAVRSVMDEDSQIGCLVRENHKKWRQVLTRPGFMTDYVESFIEDLHGLLV
ncbi:UDP-glycosyltransferase 79B6-like [Ipomoea triloba]|uniref:UDP-glycosyltransferase 79B6-like n=1 Tax=Ipomoea triloba TaxID=35885 RepID=UPI00125DF6F8|nr:UDP-glycosyltransferase 79B6-like [Ipomoea triloba]